MTEYQKTIAEILNITPDRARMVECYLRLDHNGAIDHLSQQDIITAYTAGGISECIDAIIVFSCIVVVLGTTLILIIAFFRIRLSDIKRHTESQSDSGVPAEDCEGMER